jgi:hypothetical protein
MPSASDALGRLPLHRSRYHFLRCPVRLRPRVSFVGAPTAKRPTLLSLVDVTAEAELQKLLATFIHWCSASYAATRGNFPHQNSAPTDEQLSAIHQVASAGDAPYFDFSIVGPHGRCMLKRLTCTQTLDPSTGDWQRQELPDAPDFPTWWRS